MSKAGSRDGLTLAITDRIGRFSDPRLAYPRVGAGASCQIAASARAGDVVYVHMSPDRDVGGCRAYGAAIFDDRLTSGNRPQSHLVSARNPFCDGDGLLADLDHRAGFEIIEGRRHVVAGTYDQSPH
jgi:hypothetical protein